MMDFCPTCMSEQSITLVEGIEDVTIKGETFSVRGDFLRCNVCGGKFEHSSIGECPVENGYNAYRKAHGMEENGKHPDK